MTPRIGALQLAQLRARLSARDLAIIDSVRQHRLLTSRHIMRLHFAEHATASAGIRACTRVMERLHRLRLLVRLDRPVGGLRGGSSAYVWMLDALGDRLTKTNHDARTRFLLPSTTFLAHTLSIAELHVQLVEAARAGRFELLRVQIEQAAWRSYRGPGGEARWVKPDLAAVAAVGDFEDHWMIEVDHGTESIRTVLTKCEAYEHYRRSGREQADYGIFPRVLWATTTPTRAHAIEGAIAAHRPLTAGIFTATTLEDALPLIVMVSRQAAAEPP